MGSFARWVALAGAGMLMHPGSAGAYALGFSCLTLELPGDCAIGEAQLSVEVTNPGGGQALFTFLNASGGAQSAISEIYFDDGALLAISSILDSPPDVDFALGASPPDLPGGQLAVPPFEATVGFLAEAVPPPAARGVDPGESVGILFDLQSGRTFADLTQDLTDGSLRIGIHVIDFESGGSESFVNLPVPEPGSASLLGFGLAWLLACRSRRTR